MAKSLRSKHKRKMRSIRREKFGKKELERLKGVVSKINNTSSEVEMTDLCVVKTASELKHEEPKEEDTMDTSKPKQVINPKTMQNEHGNYPVWMNQRKVKKLKKTKKLQAKKKSGKGKK